VAVVGESGSGKSVTALSIMRLVDPPSGQTVHGQVLYRGRDLLRLRERELRRVRGCEIGMVFQDPMSSLDPSFTVGDQLVETIRLHCDVGRREARRIAVESLDAVGIADAPRRLGQYPHEFSGGMRQRVVIAIALSCNPSLLIADEPTTALDVTTQSQILELLRDITAERRMAVILITHDLGIVAGFAESVNVMYAGRIVESGDAISVFEQPQHPYTWGLLGSVSRLDRPATARLHAIPGSPPSLAHPPSGCAFHPRCAFADARSLTHVPDLRIVSGSHAVACHRAEELDLTPHAR